MWCQQTINTSFISLITVLTDVSYSALLHKMIFRTSFSSSSMCLGNDFITSEMFLGSESLRWRLIVQLISLNSKRGDRVLSDVVKYVTHHILLHLLTVCVTFQCLWFPVTYFNFHLRLTRPYLDHDQMPLLQMTRTYHLDPSKIHFRQRRVVVEMADL